VQSFLIPFLKGMIAIFAITGVGKLFLRPAGIRNLPWFWRFAFAPLAGQAVVSVTVECALLSGMGSAPTLRVIAWVLVLIAIPGHLFFSGSGTGKPIAEILRADKIITAVLLLAVLINLVVALAPSTKIDELYYHMLTPKRIVGDGGLRYYLLPVESAIVPQMHYQIALSVAHASAAPDAGNVLSWCYSAALSLFVIGFLSDATKNLRLSLLCGAICGVGIYATVWHTTSGAHALGDLATVVALAGVLRPATLIDALGPYRYAFLLTTAAALAASTKISLVPLALVVSALIVGRTIRQQTVGIRSSSVIALALLPWIILHLPLMIWTYVASGSLWGPVLANAFGHSVFPPSILQDVAAGQAFDPGSLVLMAKYAVAGFSPIIFVSVAWILWTALRGCKTSRLVAALLFLQGGLVAWKFHFDFRFLGGLEFIVVVAAVLTLANPGGETSSYSELGGSNLSPAWASLGVWFSSSRRWIILFAAIPWLIFQMYYAKPFAGVVSGLTPRSEFMERYVALNHDFEILDRTLPPEAVLYVPYGRLPNFYVPRPVALTRADLYGRGPIFSLTTTWEHDVEPVDTAPWLKCGETVYQNDRAVVETYRAPGEVPLTGTIRVQRCEVTSASVER
jgi:hypothetical protein